MSRSVKKGVVPIQLTASNIGDVFQIPESGKRLKIEDVNAKYVCYTVETGERYATSERNIDANKVTNPTSIARFEENAALGRTLHDAELGALRKILDVNLPADEREEASRVLNITREQQTYLAQRISQERMQARSPVSSLNDRISAIEKKRADANHKKHTPETPQHGR